MTRNSLLRRLAFAVAMIALALPASAPLLAQTPEATPGDPTIATPAAAKPLVKPRKPEDAVTPFSRNASRHAEFMYRKTQGEIDILFLGDSITDYWPRKGEWSWLKFAPYKPADFGIAAERTENLLWRITNGELDGINPKVVVVLIGTNNIGQCPDEEPAWAAAGVTKIVETIHAKLPNAKVLLLGIFPCSIPGSEKRRKIAAVNEIIAKMDDGNKTRYLDLGNVFLNAEGGFPKVMPDLLHPNSKGYDLWYEAMNPLLTEMMK